MQPNSKKNDKSKIAVIAPANSMRHINKELIKQGQDQLSKALNLEVTFSKYTSDEFLLSASTPYNRALDIHNALLDDSTCIIMAAYGGYNTNDILPYLDYELISERNITFVGYSDITVLLNAIYAKTGQIAILGPSFTTFCDPNIFNESINSLKNILDKKQNILLTAPEYCACDEWYLKKNFGPRDIYQNNGWKIFREGIVCSKAMGGNLESLLTLYGTEYFPNHEDLILIVEANSDEPPARFIRDLVHLRQLGILEKISGLIIGQFDKDSLLSTKMITDVLFYVLKGYSYPVIYNTNFSHVDPLLSLPVGGEIKLIAESEPRIIVYPTEKN